MNVVLLCIYLFLKLDVNCYGSEFNHLLAQLFNVHILVVVPEYLHKIFGELLSVPSQQCSSLFDNIKSYDDCLRLSRNIIRTVSYIVIPLQWVHGTVNKNSSYRPVSHFVFLG